MGGGSGSGAPMVVGWRLGVPLVKDRDFGVVLLVGLMGGVILVSASKVCTVWVLLEVRSMSVVSSRMI